MSVPFALNALLSPRLAALAAHLPHARRGSLKAVHQARVASRRLREILPIVGNVAGARRLRRAVRHVRAVTRALGPVRELDVTLALVGQLTASGPEATLAISSVRRLVAEERRRRRRAMLEVITPGRVARTLRAVQAVQARLAAATPDEEWRALLAARALARAGALGHAIADVGLLFDPARLHFVRIAAKKLRYALELVAEARLAKVAPLIPLLKKTQDQLGRLHDLGILLVFIHQADTEPTPASRRSLAALREVLERECHKEHARYLRRRPRLLAIGDRVPELLPAAGSRWRPHRRVSQSAPRTSEGTVSSG